MYFSKQFLLIAFVAALLLVGCAASGPQKPKKIFYTSQNIWYENPGKVFLINYKKGKRLHAGTAVEVLKFGEGRISFFEFKPVNQSQRFRIYVEDRFQPGFSAGDAYRLLLTDKTFEAMTVGMTAEEIEAVKAGKVIKGMSKKAVRMAFGVPPKHRTGSLESNIWVYWKDRWKYFTVKFDEKGRTTEAVDLHAIGK